MFLSIKVSRKELINPKQSCCCLELIVINIFLFRFAWFLSCLLLLWSFTSSMLQGKSPSTLKRSPCIIYFLLQWRGGKMYPMEPQYYSANWLSFQHILYGLFLYQGKFWMYYLWTQSSFLMNLSCFPVHSSQWQVLVYVRTIFICGLLHHSSFICVNLPWPHMDRWVVVIYCSN